jgi:hypothetical protein
MMTVPGCLVGLLVLVADGAPPGPPGPTAEPVRLEGKALTLAGALQSLRLDVKADPDLLTRQVVLKSDEGTIIPLLSDDASRALFLDERLRGCRILVHGRRFAGVPYLQVITFQVERDGRFQTPEYFCTICSISVRYPQTCPCCQGPMELRMKPDHPGSG